jgi:hypothetical protein
MLNPQIRIQFFNFVKECESSISKITDPGIKELAVREYSILNNTLFFLSKRYGYLFPYSNKFPVLENVTVLLHPYAIQDRCYSLFFIILYDTEIEGVEIRNLENFVFNVLTNQPVIVAIPKTKTKFHYNQTLKIIGSNFGSNKYRYKTNEMSRFNS